MYDHKRSLPAASPQCCYVWMINGPRTVNVNIQKLELFRGISWIQMRIQVVAFMELEIEVRINEGWQLFIPPRLKLIVSH
jgi:hypothetical protein